MELEDFIKQHDGIMLILERYDISVEAAATAMKGSIYDLVKGVIREESPDE